MTPGMNKMNCFTVCTVLLAAIYQAAPAAQEYNYRTYTNARFKYSISYPADLLIPQGEAENGDGQVFREQHGSTEMRVYGGYNALNETLRGRFEELTRKWEKGVTYKVLRQDWFVVSALVNGRIHYQKTVLRGDTFKTFEIEYDAVRGNTYNAITDHIAKSFRG